LPAATSALRSDSKFAPWHGDIGFLCTLDVLAMSAHRIDAAAANTLRDFAPSDHRNADHDRRANPKN
jgi:hypothetical protein